MDEASVNARQENSTIFSSGDRATINISNSIINLGAGGSVAVDDRATQATQTPEQTQAEQPVNKVDEPPKDDKDLTWLSEGKIAFYRNRPLSETTPTVFYGRQQFLSEYWREVAIKVIEYEEKNLHELVLLQKLRHPNIVSLYDAGKQQGDFSDHIYIVMELCSETLTTYVKKESFTFQEAFSFVKQIVDGLEYLHDHNITHRDLKPDNVLFSPCKKLVKLSDFGLSIEIPVGRSSVTLTKVGAGTDGYRAPETYQRVYRISRSIDIFPLGLVTYFIITNGKHPYGADPYDWPVNIRKNENRDLSQIPQFKAPHNHKREQLIDLLEKMLQHDPVNRPTINKIKESAFITDALRMDVRDVFREHGKRKYTEAIAEGSDRTPGIKTIKYNLSDEPSVESAREILRNSITLTFVIHEGRFATLHKGIWGKKPVTVKKYNETERKSFDRELRSLNILRHENIVELLGKISEEPPCLVLEYFKIGNLRDYLRRFGNDTLSLVDRMIMIQRIACGMTFVSTKKFIHGDLRAQNILVGKTGVYKIASFHAAQSEADPEIVWFFRTRWSAPEVLVLGAATTKSDVWSFGVVMFEIFMNGEEPYRGLVDMEVKEKVLAGHRLHRPRSCPKHVFKMMSKCWDKNPTDRPEFKELQVLSESYEKELHANPGGGGKDTEGNSPDEPTVEPAQEILRNSITLPTVIHEGQLAIFHKGLWKGKPVIVKNYKETERKLFDRELRSLNILRHENIVQLLGKISEEPPNLVLEYLESGNLCHYLQRLGNVGLSLVDRMNMIKQIACGMTFVSKKDFIHGDLRAQNILVGKTGVYKISDFSLSRSEADDDFKWRAPMRWLAPEVLADNAISTKSDVWSFGVLMFEIFVNGETPYRDLATNMEVKDRVLAGHRLHRPRSCPENVFKVMSKCWREDPTERPEFEELQVFLESYEEELHANPGAGGKDTEAGDSSEINVKRIGRIQKIQDELKKPLDEIGFPRSAQLLSELRELRSSDDLDILLQMAECELQLARGKEEESIRRTRDFIFTSGLYSAQDVRRMAYELRLSKSYVRSLILYRISNDLHKTQNVSPDDAVNWIGDCVTDVSHTADPLIKVGGRSRDIGIKYGLEYMESLLEDIRAIGNASPKVRVIKEVSCLNAIALTYDKADEYRKSVRFGLEGVEVLEKQFGADASKHKSYGYLLNNLGVAHHNSGHYLDAERYFVRAIEAKEKALDYENENEKREDIEMTKRSLANTRKLLGQQK